MENLHLISSKDNDFFKTIKSYQTAKARRRDGILIAEGVKTYRDAHARLNLLHTVVSKSYAQAHPDFAADLEAKTVTVFADNLFEAASELITSQGILGVFELPDATLDFDAIRRIVVLDGVQNPGNVGAILRNAHCLGFEAAVLSESCAQVYSPKVIRSSMGAAFALPTYTAISAEDFVTQLKNLKAADFRLLGLDMGGSEQLPKADKIALVVGSEGSGLSSHVRTICDDTFKIKMNDQAESLNAAVATGIAMYLLS
ncbi:MAG: RNA methyltransferase [Coriobacteriia bacterium]|nr:RNA methyltransferase [Coriobacteriia bacterium]MCL2536817.1 RNA methyltransferase [Coriobacteriia bacterium]